MLRMKQQQLFWDRVVRWKCFGMKILVNLSTVWDSLRHCDLFSNSRHLIIGVFFRRTFEKQGRAVEHFHCPAYRYFKMGLHYNNDTLQHLYRLLTGNPSRFIFYLTQLRHQQLQAHLSTIDCSVIDCRVFIRTHWEPHGGEVAPYRVKFASNQIRFRNSYSLIR